MKPTMGVGKRDALAVLGLGHRSIPFCRAQIPKFGEILSLQHKT